MYRVYNEYLAKIKLSAGQDVYDSLMGLIRNDEQTDKVCINVNFNTFIVDIKLKDYSLEKADEAFRKLLRDFAYSYSSMYLRYNEASRVKYRLACCKEDKTGIAIDIIYS